MCVCVCVFVRLVWGNSGEGEMGSSNTHTHTSLHCTWFANNYYLMFFSSSIFGSYENEYLGGLEKDF